LFSIKGDQPVNPAPMSPPPSGSGGLPKVLLALVVALMVATGYLYYQIQQIQADVAATRDALTEDMAKFRETSAVSQQTNKKSVDQLKVEVDAARAQANQLVGQAKVDAEKHADELAARLEKEQQTQAAHITQVSTEVGQVKEQATTANTRIGEVSTDVTNVKTDVAATKTELEKTIANLKATQGDLGVQSGLIATNGKELAALKQLGERNYTEFDLGKTKAPQKVGEIAVLLKRTDPKKNRYTIDVIADDKTVEKKDKTINEPVQFLLSRATMPYELVVNEVGKDKIKGYVSSPKVQTPRK
jgi:hypothetical protein